MKKSIKLNAFLNTVRNVMSLVFPLITFPYVSRVLNVNGIGKYNFSSSIVSYFFLIATLGIEQYAVREGSKIRDSNKKINIFANQILTINVFSATFAYILLLICLLIFLNKLHSYLLCILICSIQIGFSVLSVEWLYTIYEDFLYITLRSIIFQILSIILLFTFVKSPGDYLNYAAVSVFSLVGSNVLNFVRAKKHFQLHLDFHFNWWERMRPILIIFAASVANVIYVNSDLTILGFIKNNYIVGIYTISSRIYVILKNAVSAMLLVSVPRLAFYYGRKEVNNFNLLLSKVLNGLIIIILPIATGLFMLSRQTVLIISGAHFLRSITSLKILCFALVFSILEVILSTCVLIPLKKEKYVLISTSLSALVNVLLNLLLIPKFNENAAAFSTVIAELLLFLMNYYFCRNIVKKIFFSKEFLTNFLESVLGCMAICIICKLVLQTVPSLLFGTTVTVILGVISYTITLLLFRNKYAISIFKILLQKLGY
ncbi:flippase [Limosilactobacillus urinaemulieris]|uniref:flippase n=1 Tax=Limosilactobacillus urinaemulieris TaxID=2742600 RepID=UPI001F57A5B4|nr:flippase [Limosilactobacillus urinaemulieris]